MASERNDDSGERPERSDPTVDHLRWAVDIGVPFVPGSIRAHVDGEPVEVVEESAEGRILLPADLPEGAAVQLDYNAAVLRAGPLHTTVIGDVGRCIYCGSSDSLQKEHVIPLALQGHLVLARASCPRCAASPGG
jgi:5-methylcytosine-specific restriction endonuclease McrA